MQNYIGKITENDIEMFAVKNNIVLNPTEIEILYTHVKKNYEVLLYGDSSPIFADLKNHLQAENYSKIYDLYIEYKQRYKNYL